MTPLRPLGSVAMLVATVTAAIGSACASPGTPPGGPLDKKAPVIVKVSPDSGATATKARSVTVTFDEVISERPRTGADLAAVVVLSPSDGPARVEWHRNAISVRPRKAFHPNTTYALTLLPGLSDLRGNSTTRARSFAFSTGPSVSRGVVRGAVFDWNTVRPANGALIEATTGGDTAFRWIARADSTGRYSLSFLPPGPYRLRTIIDANSNGRLEPRELWDSVTVDITDSLRLDLYAFAHDTLGARVVGADVKDSVTLRLIFDRPLALQPALDAGQIEVRRADSSRVRVRFLSRASEFDSLTRVRDAHARDSTLRADTSAAGKLARARADSMKVIAQRDSIERARVEARRAARDTVPRVIPPVPARRAITAEFVAVLEEPLVPGAYRVTVRNALSASAVNRTSERSFTMAKPAEKKPEAAKPGEKKPEPPAASGGKKPDSTAATGDKKPVPPAATGDKKPVPPAATGDKKPGAPA